jgi:hypothetical protein
VTFTVRASNGAFTSDTTLCATSAGLTAIG